MWIDSDEPNGPSFDWVEISGVGTPLNLYDDDYATVSLPWSFEFYGVSKTSMKISSNGYLTFGTDGTDYTNDPIPSSYDPNDLIAVFWDDLNPSTGGEVYYYYDAANDRFIVEWYQVPHYYDSGSYTFEAILYPTGQILFQYLSMVGTLNSATIGIENADASDGLQVAYNQNYVHDALAVRIYRGWLQVSPSSGIVEPGGETQISVFADASFLEAGTYQGTISISSNDPDESVVDVPVTFYVGAFPCGDANGDMVVNASDLNYLAEFLYAGGPAPVSPLDPNQDGVWNAEDLSYLANYLYSGGPPPCGRALLKKRPKGHTLR
jgi:hypothetical protein